MWCSSPATLRLEAGDQAITTSAVYVCSKTSKYEFLVTHSPEFVHAALSSVETSLTAAVPSSVSSSSIAWAPAKVVFSVWLDELTEFVEPLLDQFALVPNTRCQVSFLEFEHPLDHRITGATTEFALAPSSFVLQRQPVRIESSPFGAINSALFMGYLSNGVVSYIVESNKHDHATALMIDARYLDGMEGGGVYLERPNSKQGLALGLLVGALVKNNGEGRLTLVVPWSQVIYALSKETSQSATQILACLKEAALRGAGPRPYSEVKLSPFSGVVMVQTRQKGNRRNWGSGVFVGKDLVITNRHVVGESLSVEVWFEKYERRNVVAVSTPLDGVDLMFLKLSKAVPGRFKPVPLAALDPPAGTKVTSLGYGLFYPGNMAGTLQPLFSKGIIAKRQPTAITKDDDPASSDAGMLISTAGCWNGSSGGVVLNEQRQAVGIMASNALDEVSGEIMPDMAFVIPVGVVRRGLELIDAAPVSTSESFRKLWKLQPTHTDTRERMKKRMERL